MFPFDLSFFHILVSCLSPSQLSFCSSLTPLRHLPHFFVLSFSSSLFSPSHARPISLTLLPPLLLIVIFHLPFIHLPSLLPFLPSVIHVGRPGVLSLSFHFSFLYRPSSRFISLSFLFPSLPLAYISLILSCYISHAIYLFIFMPIMFRSPSYRLFHRLFL